MPLQSPRWVSECVMTVTICVGLRLGVLLSCPHHCHQCGISVDEFATHGHSCTKSQDRHPQHNALNEIIQRSLASAGVPSEGASRSQSAGWQAP
jgi:hypothetical protein